MASRRCRATSSERARPNLTLAESAFIAGLIRMPSALWPWSHYDRALQRSHVVLARMRAERFITAQAEQQARATPPRILASPGLNRGGSGYAEDYLRQQFRTEFDDDNPPDWKVRTTFVPAMQKEAERAVTQGLARFRQDGLQAALVAIDPQTGDVLALVGRPRLRAHAFQSRRERQTPARVGFQAIRVCGSAQQRDVAGLHALGAQRSARAGPRRVGSEKRQPRGARHVDAPRSAVRVEQPGRRQTADADRLAAGAPDGRSRRPAADARRAVARAWRRRSDAAATHRRLRGVSQRRFRRRAPADRSSARQRRLRRLQSPRFSASRSSRKRSPIRWSRCSPTSSTSARAPRPARWASAFPPRARRGRPMISRMPGSSDFRPQWSWECGWDSISPRDRPGRLRGPLRAAHLGRLHGADSAHPQTCAVPRPVNGRRRQTLPGQPHGSARRLPDVHGALQAQRC